MKQNADIPAEQISQEDMAFLSDVCNQITHRISLMEIEYGKLCKSTPSKKSRAVRLSGGVYSQKSVPVLKLIFYTITEALGNYSEALNSERFTFSASYIHLRQVVEVCLIADWLMSSKNAKELDDRMLLYLLENSRNRKTVAGLLSKSKEANEEFRLFSAERKNRSLQERFPSYISLAEDMDAVINMETFDMHSHVVLYRFLSGVTHGWPWASKEITASKRLSLNPRVDGLHVHISISAVQVAVMSFQNFEIFLGLPIEKFEV